jgi:hypothetical protein
MGWYLKKFFPPQSQSTAPTKLPDQDQQPYGRNPAGIKRHDPVDCSKRNRTRKQNPGPLTALKRSGGAFGRPLAALGQEKRNQIPD